MTQHVLQISRRAFLALGTAGAIAAIRPGSPVAAETTPSPPPVGGIDPAWRAAAKAVASDTIGPVSHVYALCAPLPDAHVPVRSLAPAAAALSSLLASAMAVTGWMRPDWVSVVGGTPVGAAADGPDALLLTADFPESRTVNLTCSPKGSPTPSVTFRGPRGVIELATDGTWLRMNAGERTRLAEPSEIAHTAHAPAQRDLAEEIVASALESWAMRRTVRARIA